MTTNDFMGMTPPIIHLSCPQSVYRSPLASSYLTPLRDVFFDTVNNYHIANFTPVYELWTDIRKTIETMAQDTTCTEVTYLIGVNRRNIETTQQVLDYFSNVEYACENDYGCLLLLRITQDNGNCVITFTHAKRQSAE